MLAQLPNSTRGVLVLNTRTSKRHSYGICHVTPRQHTQYQVHHETEEEVLEHLEQSYRQAAAPSPEPLSHGQVDVAVSRSGAPESAHPCVEQQQQQQQSLPLQSPTQPAANWQENARSQLRSIFIRQVLPVFRAVRAAERKLEADLPAVGCAIVIMVAIILYDRGINNLLDRWDDSVLGDFSCILGGLALVIGGKLLGFRYVDIFGLK